jgi:hypothetical protein
MHHFLDSTHSTAGVVRAGVGVGDFVLEASGFRGEGPDEDRLNIETPRIDSWAVRARWQRGPWASQVSGGHLRQPEWYEPFDVRRLTASMTFNGIVRSRPLAVSFAWGQNHHYGAINGTSDGFLVEWDWRFAERSTVYGRGEAVSKIIFGLGLHSKNDVHPHWLVDVGALTLGYLHDITRVAGGVVGVGADATVYSMPADLRSYYEDSRSIHFFVRWTPGRTSHSHH